MLLFFPFFSVLNKLSNFSSPHLLLFPQMHTNTSTQRYTCSKKKKKNTEKNKHTHTQTNPNGQTTKRRIGAYQNNRCLWIGTREILVRSDLVGSNRCLWIGAREIGVCGSMLARVLPDRSYGSMLVTERENWSVFRNGYRDGYRERATNQKKWVEREKECT